VLLAHSGLVNVPTHELLQVKGARVADVTSDFSAEDIEAFDGDD